MWYMIIHNIILVSYPIIYSCILPTNHSVIKLDFVHKGLVRGGGWGEDHKVIQVLLHFFI